jgi:hypothetical protein
MRDRRPASLASPGTAVKAGHFRACPGLIDKHQAIWIEVELTGKPGPAARQDIRSLLFGGVRGFF